MVTKVSSILEGKTYKGDRISCLIRFELRVISSGCCDASSYQRVAISTLYFIRSIQPTHTFCTDKLNSFPNLARELLSIYTLIFSHLKSKKFVKKNELHSRLELREKMEFLKRPFVLKEMKSMSLWRSF